MATARKLLNEFREHFELESFRPEEKSALYKLADDTAAFLADQDVLDDEMEEAWCRAMVHNNLLTGATTCSTDPTITYTWLLR